MFKKPTDDDDDDYGSRRVVKAKAISQKYVKKLGAGFGEGKDFVTGSSKSQNEFYGSQEVRKDMAGPEAVPLTQDEKNKLNAKIMKAEMKGDKDLVRKLKRKLEDGYSVPEEPKEKTVVMMERNKHGAILPATSKSSDRSKHAAGSSRMRREYEKEQDLEDMVREEKKQTAEDQLMLFSNAVVKSAKIRRHDDESLDDIAEMQKGKQKTDDKEERRRQKQQRKEHRDIERSLDDCRRCIDSGKLSKHAVVAVGINTYLAVVEWDGIDEQHCIIVPTAHASSSIQVDENVWDEMRLWRKGLTAMWKADGKDCIFLEMSRNVNQSPHVVIECIPLPDEVGETAPIYFNKAINECEGEYVDNKKLIAIKDLRKQIPKGFSYMAVDFGLSNGYAHVIEDHEKFPATFAHEIIAGMLDLPPNKWRKKETQDFTEIKRKCTSFKEAWNDYDWTKRLKKD